MLRTESILRMAFTLRNRESRHESQIQGHNVSYFSLANTIERELKALMAFRRAEMLHLYSIEGKMFKDTQFLNCHIQILFFVHQKSRFKLPS